MDANKNNSADAISLEYEGREGKCVREREIERSEGGGNELSEAASGV